METPVIEPRALTKAFGSCVAVDDLSSEVRPGRVTGFWASSSVCDEAGPACAFSGGSETRFAALAGRAPDGGDPRAGL